MAKRVYDLIIIGGGPAGITAAIYAARNKLKFLVLGLDIGGQLSWCSEVNNYPGILNSTGLRMADRFHQHLEDYKIKIRIEEVVNIEKNGKFFDVLTKKNDYKAKSIIIASGKKPKKLGIPGEERFTGKGVFYYTNFDQRKNRNKKVAVIGSGNSGLEAALFLSKHTRKVYLLEISDQITGEEYLKEKILKNKKIKVVTNAKTKKISGKKDVEFLSYEKNKKEKVLKIKSVFIEIGLISRTDFVKIVKKNKWGEIKIFRSTRTHEENLTSVPGIFAAGDVTDVPSKQIVVAAGEGAKAALAAVDYIRKLNENEI